LGLLFVALALSGCGVVNYGMPSYSSCMEESPKAQCALNTPLQIAHTADFAAKEYAMRAGSAANTAQFFEVPAIGAAVGVVAGTIFSATTQAIQATALGGATAIAVDQYYAPTKRAAIYANGGQAMSCITVLAYQTSQILFAGQDSASTDPSHFSPAFNAFIEVYNGGDLTNDQKAALQPLADLPFHSVAVLAQAVNGVDVAVLKQNLSTVSTPNLQSLTSSLRSGVQQSTVTKKAGQSAGSNSNVRLMLQRSNTSIAAFQYLINFAADFDNALKICTALAGGS
jgi:hypothetical protein